MDYQIQITQTATKERKKLPGSIQTRIDKAIENLGHNPRPHGARKISGSINDWRIRVGDYRVLYEIDDTISSVTIWRISHRKSAYR